MTNHLIDSSKVITSVDLVKKNPNVFGTGRFFFHFMDETDELFLTDTCMEIKNVKRDSTRLRKVSNKTCLSTSCFPHNNDWNSCSYALDDKNHFENVVWGKSVAQVLQAVIFFPRSSSNNSI